MGVVTELCDGYQGAQETQELRSSSGVRVFLTDWATRKTDAPQLGDTFPGNSRLTCVRRTFNGIGKPSGGYPNEYTKCRVVCEYIDEAAQTDGEAIISSDYAVDVLTVGLGRTWSDGITAVDMPLSVIIPMKEFTARISMPLALAHSNSIMNNIGKLNDSQWAFGGCIYPTGTVMFMGASETIASDAIYGLKAMMEFKFYYRAIPHNYAWRSDSNEYDYTTPLLYESFDFSELGLY